MQRHSDQILVGRTEVQKVFAAISTRLPRERISPGLFSGLAGIAWVSMLAKQEFGYTFAVRAFSEISIASCGNSLKRATFMDMLS